MFNLSMADLISDPPRRSRTRTPTPTTTPTTTTPETDTETPPTKPITDHQHLHPLNQHFNYNNPYNNHSKIILSFTNGGLKRQHHPKTPTPPPPPVVVYKECLKNHAASLGGHALDGCGEFMPSPTSTAAAINNNNPTLLKCAACGCHRNFHRREPDIDEYYPLPQNLQLPAPPVPLLRGRERSPNSSASPPPISSAYYPSSAPHMLLALSAGNLSSGPPSDHHHPQQEQHHYQNRTGNNTTTTTVTTTPAAGNAKYSNGGGSGESSSRKRFRTKFSEEQKDKMRNFSEKLGWKLQKRDDNLIAEFCDEIGVGRSVLKVWMHNNKNTLGKANLSNSISSINLHTTTNNSNINNYNDSTSPSNDHNYQHQVHHHHHQHSGSSSSD